MSEANGSNSGGSDTNKMSSSSLAPKFEFHFNLCVKLPEIGMITTFADLKFRRAGHVYSLLSKVEKSRKVENVYCFTTTIDGEDGGPKFDFTARHMLMNYRSFGSPSAGPKNILVLVEDVVDVSGGKSSLYKIQGWNIVEICKSEVHLVLEIDFVASATFPPLSKSLVALGEDLRDFEIVVSGEDDDGDKGRSLMTYKVLLAARSEVFRAMLTNPDCTESKTGKLVLKDNHDPDVVERFLSVIMKDEVGRDEIAPHEIGLYELGHKYHMESLMKLCGAMISEGIDVDNCVERIKFGMFYNDEGIRKAAGKVFKENKKAVTETDGWKELEKNCLDLVCQFLKSLV